MGVSRATSHAAVPSGIHASPFELLEFAISQAVNGEGAAPEAGLPDLLRRCVTGSGGRAALALRLPAPGEPAVIAAHPHAAVDPGFMVQVTALLDSHSGVASAGGCLQGQVAWPTPGAAGRQHGVLIGVSRMPGDRSPCALVLVAEWLDWPAEWQSTARALATVIAARIRRAADTREIAERRVMTEALIGAAPDAVVVADAERRIVEFNPAAEELYARPRAEVIGQSMADLIIPERNRAKFLESTGEFLHSQDPGEFIGRMHLPMLHADGTERTVELTPLPLVVGGETYFCSFDRDVTELQRANAALAASKARLRLLSELAPVGIARTDDAADVCSLRQRALVCLGRLAKDMLGSPGWNRCTQAMLRGSGAEWERARAAGAELRTDCRLRPNGGPQLWVYATVASLPDRA